MKRKSIVNYLALAACLVSVSARSSPRAAGSTFKPNAGVDVESATRQAGRKAFESTSRGGAVPVVAKQEMSQSTKEVLGAGAFFFMNEIFRKMFALYEVPFPAMLGGCILLFVFLIVAEIVSSGTGDYLYDLLLPGSGLLAKWLPVLFVPGLAMLPRAPSVGTGLDVLKIIGVVGVGYLFSLSTTGFSVLALRKAQGAVVVAPPVPKAVAVFSSAPKKPYSPETLDFLVKSSVLAAAISIAATRANNEFATPLKTIFFGVSTVAAYVWSARLPLGFTKAVHPLVTCTGLTLLFIKLYGLATDAAFMDVLATYKVGTLELAKTGAGDILLHLLGPAVISFAMSMYSRKTLLKENLPVVLLAMLVSSGGGMFGTALLVRLLRLGGRDGSVVRLSVLPRNVTTALAIAITNILGGDISICASVVVLTGIVAATYSRALLDKLGIQDPISRGLAVGAAGQGLGVSSMIPEKDAFPFAAMAMVLTAVCSTSLVSIPFIKELIVDIATGGAAEKVAAAATA